MEAENSREILSNMVCVAVEASIPDGSKKLQPEDLHLSQDQIPPESVASLGSKRYIDPEETKPFHRYKKRAQRLGDRYGMRFMGGHAIPHDKIGTYLDELRSIIEQFYEAKDELLPRYDEAVRRQAAKSPELEQTLIEAAEPVSYWENRLQMDYVMFEIAHPQQDDGSLDRQVDRMGDQLLAEVAKEADHLFENSIAGKHKLTRSVLKPLTRIREKLDGLEFLDRDIAPVVRAIDDVMGRIPASGPMQPYQSEVIGLVSLLSDPDKIRRLAVGALTIPEMVDGGDAEQADEEPAMAKDPDTGKVPEPAEDDVQFFV